MATKTDEYDNDVEVETKNYATTAAEGLELNDENFSQVKEHVPYFISVPENAIIIK